ncbi:MAG TPA: hypothetical protein EYG89_02045 [Bacteroidia bacterium]|nr:hypothetical protein [Bacteroidia bacterium]
MEKIMELIIKKTPQTEKTKQLEIKNMIQKGLSGFHSDDLTTYVFTTTRRESFDTGVKALNLIMELPYIYNQTKMFNDPDLMKEYSEIFQALKTIEKVAGKRAFKQRKSRREKRERETQNKNV